ncbi:unnamed protein product [Parascedosporium putredinis]|uniref:Mediator of RNA polymerase II transcription subunit 13 n=1 Tax=Parascedosporium putredinis TaxID=1442378 RepID=A0A9P1H7S3_9PEZI|nr:unnamed protein product [Parascedosporium putredinis]CAI7999944.1 unnamed protein product [Parascedosporium putredinis]
MEAGEYTINALVINNITSISYRTYELSATDQYQSQPNPTVIQDVESLFRTQGCIAHFDTSRRIIWHFGVTRKENTTSPFSTGPSLPDNLDIPGVTLSPFFPVDLKPASFGAITVNDAYENFILALLGTVLAELVKRTGAIPLIALSLFSLPFAETPILLAPFGVRASSQGAPDIGLSHLDTGAAQTPDTQISRFQDTRSTRWRQVCSRLLQLKGIPAQVLDSCPCSASLPPISRLGGNLLLGRDESYDPLERAKAWFQEAPERGETAARRKENARQRCLPTGGKCRCLSGRCDVSDTPDAIQNPSAPTPSLDGVAATSPHTHPPSVAVTDTDVAIVVIDSSQPEPKSVPPKPESPVFAKPELRHARSVLGDDAKSGGKQRAPSIVKREHSPFDPDTVFKRVRTALYRPAHPGTSHPTRRRSVYDKVEFDALAAPVTSKYVNGGKYAFTWSPSKEDVNPKAPPTTDYLRRHGKNGKTLKGLPENHGALIARITTGLESSSINASPAKIEGLADLDIDDTSSVSDQDDTSVSSAEPFSPVKSAGPRKANNEDDLISHAASLRDVEVPDDSDPSFVLELPRLGRAWTAEMSVAKLFADPEPLTLQLNLPDGDMIAIAQILTEQAALGALEVQSDTALRKPPPACPVKRRQLASLSRQALRALQDSLPANLGGASECLLRAFSEIQDGTPPLGPPSRPLMPSRPVGGRDPSSSVPPTVYQIPPPHLEVKRAETRLSVLPSAALFWESLGFGPSMGPKDVRAACVFPGWDGMPDNAGAFLERLKSVYESMKLGSFETLESTDNIVDGLVRYDVDKISMTPGTVFPRISSALAERVELLCQALRGTTASSKNLQLSEAYKSSHMGKNSTPPNEVVLQLVPLDLICASFSVVIQSPASLVKLCLEVYDRCASFNGTTPAPSIMLEQVSPRFIDFSLQPTPSASVMHENSCIHVAYARSINGRWVTAAWTDSRGSQQMTASYCLGRKGRPIATPFTDVAHEIWETTHDLISMWKVHWRVVITKCGTMDADEMEFWTGLAQTESKARVSLVLMAVDTSPSVQLLPPAIRLNPSVSATFYTTPASTPQASILSPEQSGNPATPANAPTPSDANAADGATSDGILVDIMDQSWGCILGHRLNNSTSPTEINPALFSGYLIKRGGTKLEDPPVVMEVNVIYSDGTNPRQHEGCFARC